MNRPGEPTVEELMARIAALQAQNRQLAERVVKLEEELALARLHRFAPKSEKHIDRLFNEAEQAADEDDTDSEDDDVADLPDTGLPVVESKTGKKRGRKALPENLPRERVELFAHLKRILKLDRLRLRGPNGARDEFHLAATAQNLRKLAKLIPVPMPKPA